MRVLGWNVYVGQSAARVRAALLLLVALTWPHVIALQEAKRLRGSLPGYRRLAAPPGYREDAANMVVLVRKSLQLGGSGPVPVPEDAGRWRFRIRKPARVFYCVRAARLTIVDVHRCVWGYSRNPEAWEAEHDTLLAVGQRAGDLLMVGDWNAPADSRHPLSPAALAAQLGADIVADSPKAIDYAIVRGRHVRVRKLRAKYGSDHAPRLYTL